MNDGFRNTGSLSSVSDSVSFYNRRILPNILDRACGLSVLAEARQRVLPLARGRVLEIGVGAGANFPYYDQNIVTELVAVDASSEMIARARRRSEVLHCANSLRLASANALPFADGSLDTVVTTYSFCSFADPVTALNEVRRVLKPNGQLLFCEHCLAPDRRAKRWQERLTPLWRRLFGGCHLNRNFPVLLLDQGFAVEYFYRGYHGMPRWLTFSVEGRASLKT